MDRTQQNPVKASSHESRELLVRYYREIGISAVAAALAPVSFAVEEATKPVAQNYPIAGRIAA